MRFATALAVVLLAGSARAAAAQVLANGSTIEHDSTVKKRQPGPHGGGGMSTAYDFFAKAPGFGMAFRKRALHPGAAIGYHEQKEDEIYYVLSGRGLMTIDGKDIEVGPGTAVLTRPGSSHGLKQVGSEDLVIMINYLQAPKPPAKQ